MFVVGDFLRGEVDDEFTRLLVICIRNPEDQLLHFDVSVFGCHLDGVNDSGFGGALVFVHAERDHSFGRWEVLDQNCKHEGGESGLVAAIPVQLAFLGFAVESAKFFADGFLHDDVEGRFVFVIEESEDDVVVLEREREKESALSFVAKLIRIGSCGKESGDERGTVLADGVEERGVACRADFFDRGAFDEQFFDGCDVVMLNSQPETSGDVFDSRHEELERGAEISFEGDL